MLDLEHSIKVAAQRTGLTAHVIRVWERRYAAVEPRRTPTNRRVYSEADLERLRLLRHATSNGHNIGSIAKLSTPRLRDLVSSEEAAKIQSPLKSLPAAKEQFLDEALRAIKALDPHGLEATLNRALIAMGHQGLLERLIVPIAHEVGERWRCGEITAAHEHFASAVIRVFLGTASKPFAADIGAPSLVVATPAGQLHELGAAIVSAAATSLGWNVVYLGIGLPAAEIAGAVLQHRCRAVALSIVYPTDDPGLPQELVRLREYLAKETQILVGGRAAAAYEETLTQIGATVLESLEALYPVLDRLRAGRR